MNATTTPTMPMGAAALSATGNAPLPPIFPPSKGAPMPGGSNLPPALPPALPPSMPPTGPAMGAAGGPPGMPAPNAPAAPPYTVRLQPDGSSVYSLQTPNGEVVLGVNPPPKVPKAFSAATPPAQ